MGALRQINADYQGLRIQFKICRGLRIWKLKHTSYKALSHFKEIFEAVFFQKSPLSYCCTKTSKFQNFIINQWSCNKLGKSWLLLSVTSSRFYISFGCLLRRDLKMLLDVLKTSLVNLCIQPSGKSVNAFNPGSILGPQTFTMTQKHESTAFCEMWIAVKITRSGNANISKTFISLWKLKRFLWASGN